MLYSISCSDCKKQYTGETGRYIAERVSEHRMHTVKGNVSESALAKHTWDSGHVINWDSGHVIAWDSCKILGEENPLEEKERSKIFYNLFTGYVCMHPLYCCAFYTVCHFTDDELLS